MKCNINVKTKKNTNIKWTKIELCKFTKASPNEVAVLPNKNLRNNKVLKEENIKKLI